MCVYVYLYVYIYIYIYIYIYTYILNLDSSILEFKGPNNVSDISNF